MTRVASGNAVFGCSLKTHFSGDRALFAMYSALPERMSSTFALLRRELLRVF